MAKGKIKRKTYTDEFKAKAVKAAGLPGATVDSVAKQVGVHHTVLRTWLKKAEGTGKSSSPRTRPSALAVLQTEIDYLERALKSMKDTVRHLQRRES